MLDNLGHLTRNLNARVILGILTHFMGDLSFTYLKYSVADVIGYGIAAVCVHGGAVHVNHLLAVLPGHIHTLLHGLLIAHILGDASGHIHAILLGHIHTLLGRGQLWHQLGTTSGIMWMPLSCSKECACHFPSNSDCR